VRDVTPVMGIIEENPRRQNTFFMGRKEKDLSTHLFPTPINQTKERMPCPSMQQKKIVHKGTPLSYTSEHLSYLL